MNLPFSGENLNPLNQVLLIDDDEIFINLMLILNKKLELSKKIVAISNPNEAFKTITSSYFNESEFQLILLDINMPLVDGWQILDEMKNHDLKLPVVVMSSSINPNDKERALSYQNVIRFISKPPNESEINQIKQLTLSFGRQ